MIHSTHQLQLAIVCWIDCHSRSSHGIHFKHSSLYKIPSSNIINCFDLSEGRYCIKFSGCIYRIGVGGWREEDD